MVRVSLAGMWNDGSEAGDSSNGNGKPVATSRRTRNNSRHQTVPAGQPFNPPPAATKSIPLHPFAGISEIISPDGEVVSVADTDGVIDLGVKAKTVGGQWYQAELAARWSLWAMSEGVGKTRRVRGKRLVAKLEAAAEQWEQKVLLELWLQYPELAPQFLRIERLAPKLREVAKLLNSTGDEDFCDFRDRLLSACKGSTGAPTLTKEGG